MMQGEASAVLANLRTKRNKYGFEVPPAPKIPYVLWPVAIVGALLFAHLLNVMWEKRRNYE